MGVKCFWLEPIEGLEAPGHDPRRYRRVDTGEVMTLPDAPPGAMWDADWMSYARTTLEDGTEMSLVVRLPNGQDWMPGGRSSNCTRRGEEHDCWCIHGTPPNLTVDKNPLPGRSTCQAGGGSVGSGSGEHYWHGFLRDGFLVT